MRTPSRKELCSVALAVLLFLPAMPAGAASTAEGGIDLHLEEALTLQGADFLLARTASDEGLSSRLESPADSRSTPELRRKSFEEVALQMRKKGDDEMSQQPNSGGFGGWVKKHWYVPVLAAIAIGLVVADSDDNDAAGEED